MSALWIIIRPFAGYIIGALAIAGLYTGWYFKVKHDGAVQALQKVEQEKASEIQKANKARDRVRTLCRSTPMQCAPDDWFRD